MEVIRNIWEKFIPKMLLENLGKSVLENNIFISYSQQKAKNK